MEINFQIKKCLSDIIGDSDLIKTIVFLKIFCRLRNNEDTFGLKFCN